MLLSNTKFKIQKIGEVISTWVDGHDLFLWDHDTKNLETIKGFYDDYFDMEIENLNLSVRGEVVHLKYSAIDFKEKLVEALENGELSEKKISEFTKLNQQISEEDNPVFLIGHLAN